MTIKRVLGQNKLDEMQAETLKEYMLSYAEQKDKIERFDEKIEEIARMDRYSKLVSNVNSLKIGNFSF